jgi:hypothetical protein
MKKVITAGSGYDIPETKLAPAIINNTKRANLRAEYLWSPGTQINEYAERLIFIDAINKYGIILPVRNEIINSEVRNVCPVCMKTLMLLTEYMYTESIAINRKKPTAAEVIINHGTSYIIE